MLAKDGVKLCIAPAESLHWLGFLLFVVWLVHLVCFFFFFSPSTSILANVIKQACKLVCLRPAHFHQPPLISKGCQQSSTSSPEEVLCEPAEMQMMSPFPAPQDSVHRPEVLTMSVSRGPGCKDGEARPTRASAPWSPWGPLGSSAPCSRASLVALPCFTSHWNEK